MKYMIMHYASQADIDAANMAHGLGHGSVGAAVAAWPTVALVGSYELLMMASRGSQVVQDGVPGKVEARDPLQEQAVGRSQARSGRAPERLIWAPSSTASTGPEPRVACGSRAIRICLDESAPGRGRRRQTDRNRTGCP